jgi:hypothetical protein
MKICVINFASGDYVRGQERLRASLKKIGFAGDLLFFTNELPPDSPPHDDAPWAFKVYGFAEARRRGYDLALWIDSNGIAIRPLDRLFRRIQRSGYYLWGRRSAAVGEWISDRVLSSFNLSRDEAMKIPEIAAFCVGLNFRSETANRFLDEWLSRARDGFSFRGIPKEYSLSLTNSNAGGVVSTDPRVKGHRHDQTVASILAFKYRMKHSPDGCFDYVGEAGPGRDYAAFIPLNAVLLQNRDIKTDHYLPDVDKWGNRRGRWTRVWWWWSAALFTLRRGLKNVVRRLIWPRH